MRPINFFVNIEWYKKNVVIRARKPGFHLENMRVDNGHTQRRGITQTYTYIHTHDRDECDPNAPPQ